MEVTTRPVRKLGMELGLSKERMGQLDAAEAAALGPKAAPAPAALEVDEPPITADAAAARQKARKAKQDAEDAEAAKPKPGLLDRAKKAIGL